MGAAFFFVALPLGLKGIIVFAVVGWELALTPGALMGGAVGGLLGFVPSVISAYANRGKRVDAPRRRRSGPAGGA